MLKLLLGLVVGASSLLQVAVGQSTVVQQRRVPSGPLRPISLSHLYWQFLAYQDHLDSKAAEQNARGVDGSKMRNVLQQRLSMNDTDYAQIRASSVRLAVELRNLDSQAAAVKSGGMTSQTYAQLGALAAQRDQAINAEITVLRGALSSNSIRMLEYFMSQMFSLRNAVPRPASIAQPSTGAVQQ